MKKKQVAKLKKWGYIEVIALPSGHTFYTTEEAKQFLMRQQHKNEDLVEKIEVQNFLLECNKTKISNLQRKLKYKEKQLNRAIHLNKQQINNKKD